MNRYRVTQLERYRVTYEVEAETERAAWQGDVEGVWEEVSRDDGEYEETLEVELVRGSEPE